MMQMGSILKHSRGSRRIHLREHYFVDTVHIGQVYADVGIEMRHNRDWMHGLLSETLGIQGCQPTTSSTSRIRLGLHPRDTRSF